MSFTNTTLIKKHLLEASLPQREIKNFQITLNGTDDTELPHRSLEENSLIVKWIAENALTEDGPVTLNDYDTASLSHSHIVSRTVVAALSETLNTVYVEEADYKLSDIEGKINRVVGTNIPDGQPLVLYYEKFTLFALGSDYEVDNSNGWIHRTSSGAIPDGASVFVDYTVSSGSVRDDLIDQTVLEAQDLIVRFLSPSYNGNSADTGLQIGATELALSIIARDMAANCLAELRSSDAASRAKQWQELSAFYESKAYRTLAPFLIPHSLYPNLRRNNNAQNS